ncbi:MAG TPA: hypothetical protein VN081_05035 [Dongiaceae bacterium]|nr:hypothetical protein [Dongiaceae bacterium]
MADIITSTNQDIIDYLFRLAGYGSKSQSAANALLGINHRGVGVPQPTNTDVNGIVFFTKPCLNLTYDNLQADRRMMPLAAQDSTSYQRYIRNSLDPDNQPNLPSTLCDPDSAFISTLSNNILSLSGWPDPYMGTYDTKEGKYKEVVSLADGVAKDYSAFPLQTTFRNIAGDPISLLIYYWLIYMGRVTDGTMVPYPDSMIRNEIDYTTRIYYFVLDRSRKFIQKAFNCGAAFPVGVPLGQAGNFDSTTPFNLANATLSIQWHCNGVEINDPISFEDFNRTVQNHNPTMGDDTRADNFTQLKSTDELMLGNYFGYPWIDLETQELQWWSKNEDYNYFTANPMTVSGVPALSSLAAQPPKTLS